ncbi:MAG TPA: hypothetical protein VFO41_17385, partial [Alphaproteobacteria bacterium]|nr:hypothetical protein [Alphaproteobacteria bacterium]
CAWNGTKALVLATGVDDFVVSEMRIANIVDRVHVFGAEGAVDDLAAANCLFLLMRGRPPASGELEWPALQERLSKIRNGLLNLLKFEPVYGATILLLAKEVRLRLTD